MPLQSSGAISLAQIQTELGGANPIGVDEYTGLFGLKSKFGYVSNNTGILTIIPGGAATHPPSGFTSSQNGTVDDTPTIELAFNFNYKFLGVSYASLFISPNTYITFSGSSGVFGGYSGSNPPLPKIFIGSADNSFQRVSYKRGPENSYLRIRYEGTRNSSGTVGSPNIVYEIIFYDPRSTSNLSKFDLYIGNHASPEGPFKICSATSDIVIPANANSLTPNNAYQFTGNADGNNWAVQSGTSNLLCVDAPVNNPIQFTDFYGLSSVVASPIFDNLTSLGNYLRPFLTEFQNPSFFNYALDGGDSSFIADGGGDMYDNGNFTTPVLLSNATYTSNASSIDAFPSRIQYANTTRTTLDTDFSYVSVSGHTQGSGTTNRPLMVMGTRTIQGNPIGWQKGGNSGADGGGALNAIVLRNAVVYNGFTVHAFTRQTFNAGDPSHCDVYVLLGHPNWASVFGTVTNFADLIGNGGNGGSFSTSGPTVKNILAITYLLSKSGGAVVTNAEVDTTINALINRIKTYFGY